MARGRGNSRIKQLAVVAVAIPIAGWGLEQAANRVEAKSGPTATSRRMRQGAQLIQGFGRGPLANKLREGARKAADTTTNGVG